MIRCASSRQRPRPPFYCSRLDRRTRKRFPILTSIRYVAASLNRQQISLRRAGLILPSRNASRANRRCGKSLWVNGRRFCRAKRPTASARKGEDWRAIRISSAVSKWRETPASSIKVNKKQRHYGRARVPYSRKARHQQSRPCALHVFPGFHGCGRTVTPK